MQHTTDIEKNRLTAEALHDEYEQLLRQIDAQQAKNIAASQASLLQWRADRLFELLLMVPGQSLTILRHQMRMLEDYVQGEEAQAQYDAAMQTLNNIIGRAKPH